MATPSSSRTLVGRMGEGLNGQGKMSKNVDYNVLIVNLDEYTLFFVIFMNIMDTG